MTEQRLIDANALMKENMYGNTAPITHRTYAEMLIQKAPTVDAVEVVRCKDCTNFERKFPGYGYCYHWDCEPGMSPNEVEDNDFCSYGERRTDE